MDDTSTHNFDQGYSVLWIQTDDQKPSETPVYDPDRIDTDDQKPSETLLYDPDNFDNIVSKYFEKKQIKALFDFMVQHLIIHEPDNPIEYLKDLADKLLMWRSGTVTKAPQLFEERHLEAIYTALDPGDVGAISLEQYHNGFKTLMLERYNAYPELNHEQGVEKEAFIKNALTALDENLMSLVMPPYSTLCELTILPNKSYDMLFKDETEEDVSLKKPDDQMIDKEPSEVSCPSDTSCVKLIPRIDGHMSQVSVFSDVSVYSDGDNISMYETDGNDFLRMKSLEDGNDVVSVDYKRRTTLQGSEVTILDGKTGHHAKILLAENMSLGSVTEPTQE